MTISIPSDFKVNKDSTIQQSEIVKSHKVNEGNKWVHPKVARNKTSTA